MTDLIEFHDDPDIQIEGFRLWVTGRQFPHLEDYWDANWLTVVAECSALGARVQASGSFIHLSEIEHFLGGLQRVYKELEGEAALPCMEPELRISLIAKTRGQIELNVHLTPDHINQSHHFIFEIDQSYLGNAIAQCSRLLREYPIKGVRAD